jgi:hypothetical protein
MQQLRAILPSWASAGRAVGAGVIAERACTGWDSSSAGALLRFLWAALAARYAEQEGTKEG